MPFKRQYNKLLGKCISLCGVFFITGTLESNTGQLFKSKDSTKDSELSTELLDKILTHIKDHWWTQGHPNKEGQVHLCTYFRISFSLECHKWTDNQWWNAWPWVGASFHILHLQQPFFYDFWTFWFSELLLQLSYLISEILENVLETLQNVLETAVVIVVRALKMS